jgi:hypothetical protein
MKTISAKIPDTDSRILDRIAEQTPGGKSAVIREAVHFYCVKHANSKAKLDAAIDSVFGIFKHAPIDADSHRRELSKRIL